MLAQAAKEAVACGVDGILVSAHGGRQLDGVPAPVSQLLTLLLRISVYIFKGLSMNFFLAMNTNESFSESRKIHIN